MRSALTVGLLPALLQIPLKIRNFFADYRLYPHQISAKSPAHRIKRFKERAIHGESNTISQTSPVKG